MSQTTRCPSCSMTAERDDPRRWIPLLFELEDWRRCRNCGADVDLGAVWLEAPRATP